MTSLSDLPLRDSLRGREPYGAPQLHVPVALNVNENTHPLAREVIDDIVSGVQEAAKFINRYPDREFTKLRQALASYLGHGLEENQIWAANGSNEILQQLFQAFGGPGRKALGFRPTYSMYSIIASGTDTGYVDAERAERFELNPEIVSAAIREHKPAIVLLCSPNNPTGTPLSLECIEAAYEATDGMVVVDEAYAEFSSAKSAISLLPGRPRLAISRTMSKAFAFAGARVGYLAADPAVVDAMRLVRLPYHLSAFTQAAAEGALRHSASLLAAVEDIRKQRDRLLVELRNLGFDPYPSDANFVLFGGVRNPDKTFTELLARGVLVRNVGLANTLRVTAGTESETTAFLDALAELQAN